MHPSVKAYNSNSHAALMGSAPEDVKGMPVLQYDLERQIGFDVARNTTINERSRIDQLRTLGVFRLLMPRNTATPGREPGCRGILERYISYCTSSVRT